METSPKQVGLTIDGRLLSVPEGTTILEAARQNSIRIPTLCHHPALSAWGGCRLCVVEVDGSPKLVASCVMPVREGMAVVTGSDAIILARRTILEYLFAERNHYCMFCSQSGACELQSLAYELQMDHLTVPQSFEPYPVDVTSQYMAIDHNRCVLCGRCVRACSEIAGAYVLNYQRRGIKNQVAFDMDVSREDSSCLSCGACLQLCPTGAIFNRYRSHRRVLGHEKSLRTVTHGFCSRCGLLCETHTLVENNQIVRIDGVLTPGNPGPERGQLCVKGRFETLKTPGRRLYHPMMRDADGVWKEVSWKTAKDLLVSRMGADNAGTFGLISSRCANEQLMIFRDLCRKGWAVDTLDTLDGGALRVIACAWKALSRNFLAFKEAGWRRIADADHLLVVGSSETQPLIGGLIRRAILEKSSTVTVLGTCDTLGSWSTHHVPVPSGNEALMARAFLGQALNRPGLKLSSGWKPVLSGPAAMDIPGCLNQAGLEKSAQVSFTAAVDAFVRSKNPMVIAGNCVIAQGQGDFLHHLMLLSLIKGVLPENALRLVILKPCGNSAGALNLGLPAEAPVGAWRCGLMMLEDENLEGLPVLDQLKGADFLAVITPYFPEALKGMAHVLIPRPVSLEEEGTYASLDGQEIRTLHAALQRPKGVSESWQTLLALMQRTDFHPSYARWKDISARVIGEMRSQKMSEADS